jgi:hypothetical protein
MCRFCAGSVESAGVFMESFLLIAIVMIILIAFAMKDVKLVLEQNRLL